MRSILHIVRKDLRLLSGRLAVWLAVVAAKTIAGIYLVGSADLKGADFGAIQGALLTLSVTDVALTFLIAGLLVHADGVAGSDAGWMTRPIAGWRLLVAKLMTAGLALVLPAVVLAWPWWWYCGFGGRELAVASLELVVLQAMIVLPVMTVASVTRTLPQLAIWTVVGVSGALLAMGARIGLMRVFGGGYGERMMVFALLVLVLVAIVLPWHYARRSWYRTVTALAAGAVFAALGAGDLAGICRSGGRSVGPSEARVGGSPEVKVELASARVDQSRARLSEPDTVRLRYRVEGVPKRYALGSGVVGHSWAKAGESFSVTSHAWGTFAGQLHRAERRAKPGSADGGNG